MQIDVKKMPMISIIAAISTYDRAIGNDNELLWHISEDLKRFKKITENHPVIMGRKTFESIRKQIKGPLPNRTNIVITRDKSYLCEKVMVVHSLEKALKKAQAIDTTEIFIIGGAQIYEQSIHFADKLYLTLIEDRKKADAYFPPYKNIFVRKIFEKKLKTENGLKYSWVNLEHNLHTID